MHGREGVVSGTESKLLCVLFVHKNRDVKRRLKDGPHGPHRGDPPHRYSPSLSHCKADCTFYRARDASDDALGSAGRKGVSDGQSG